MGAAATTAQALWIWNDALVWHPLIPLVFLGTLSMYILHRSIGLYRIMQRVQSIPKRFKPILNQRVFFIVIGIVSSLTFLYVLFAYCSGRTRWLFLPALAISFFYAVPLLGKKRLRDYGWIKVPLLALTWAWITAFIPLQTVDWPPDAEVVLFVSERFFLLMAITLPFEVRDIKVDFEEGVQTLVHRLGVHALRGLATGCALLGMGASMMLFVLHVYTAGLLIALLISWFVVLILIYFLSRERKAAYFEIGFDGILILQAGLVYFVMEIL